MGIFREIKNIFPNAVHTSCFCHYSLLVEKNNSKKGILSHVLGDVAITFSFMDQEKISYLLENYLQTIMIGGGSSHLLMQ